MIVNRHIDRLFILILPAGLFVFLSIRPVMHLPDDPPSEFLEPDPTWNAKRRAQEEELARAYWKSAAGTVQWQYGYGATLPPGPPDDFKIEGGSATVNGLSSDSATRVRYWSKFRHVWTLPQCWQSSYGWDMSWVYKTFVAIHDWFIDTWEHRFWKA